ncbi:hypothetical protein KFL_003940130 [Klebsormidium nitens]|uniref:CCHC-type domain-containing protein n=1 Tax=Klebsormidium nitens TaxID=105231 RepID=A0A1Y1IDI8_KLENI|nr:hypothetical protein KFL_003940130 [Klebsormidium nitens]|eukprot:GAQ88022.1 hypothetical protein KFL_003940130 [Klebsormidium nitens]
MCCVMLRVRNNCVKLRVRSQVWHWCNLQVVVNVGVLMATRYASAVVSVERSARVSDRYSGRPGSMALEDFEDRLEAEYARACMKEKKLSRADFLKQLPAFLEDEALQVWRGKRKDILTPPKEGVSEWDPLEEVVALFREEFGAASADKVRELKTLQKRPDETCRMLKARLQRLARETGSLNEQDQALAFLKALPRWLREKVEVMLWGGNRGGVSLNQAFELAENIDLGQAFSEELEPEPERVVEFPTGPFSEEPVRAAVAVAGKGPCYRCGAADHIAGDCRVSSKVQCRVCRKTGHAEAACWQRNPSLKPEWAGGAEKRENGRPEQGGDLRAEVTAMKSELGELRSMMAELLKRSDGGGGGATARTKADVIAARGGVVLEDWEIGSDDEPTEERARREQLARIHGYD